MGQPGMLGLCILGRRWVGFLVASICRLCGQCVCCLLVFVGISVCVMKVLGWDCFELFFVMFVIL